MSISALEIRGMVKFSYMPMEGRMAGMYLYGYGINVDFWTLYQYGGIEGFRNPGNN